MQPKGFSGKGIKAGHLPRKQEPGDQRCVYVTVGARRICRVHGPGCKAREK